MRRNRGERLEGCAPHNPRNPLKSGRCANSHYNMTETV